MPERLGKQHIINYLQPAKQLHNSSQGRNQGRLPGYPLLYCHCCTPRRVRPLAALLQESAHLVVIVTQ